jgi:hypothetical protein
MSLEDQEAFMKRLIAFAAATAAVAALAQAAPSSGDPNQGFFRPSDLASPPAPLVAVEPGVARPSAALAGGVAATAMDAIDEIRRTEEMRVEEIRRADELRHDEREMDRLERENERARLQAPVMIDGAYNGLTDERNR